jgi:hypothetical protein
MLATTHVELKTMPRASDDAARQNSLAQRAPLVRANAIERKKLAVDVEERDNAASDDAFSRRARRAFFKRCDGVPGHAERVQGSEKGESDEIAAMPRIAG